MDQSKKEFMAFLRSKRAAAASAYVSGDGAPVTALSASAGPATFLGPGGGIVEGAKQVNAGNEKGAKGFAPGGKSEFKIVQAEASDHLAFWTGLQKARVKFPGKRGNIPMTLRITEVFRREKSGWKMIHRHADMLAKKGK